MRLFLLILTSCLSSVSFANVDIKNELDTPVTVQGELNCNPAHFFVEDLEIASHGEVSIDDALIAKNAESVCFVIHEENNNLVAVENITQYENCSLNIQKKNEIVQVIQSVACKKPQKI